MNEKKVAFYIVSLVLAIILSLNYFVFQRNNNSKMLRQAYLCEDIGRQDLTEDFVRLNIDVQEAESSYQAWIEANDNSNCNNVDYVTYQEILKSE